MDFKHRNQSGKLGEREPTHCQSHMHESSFTNLQTAVTQIRNLVHRGRGMKQNTAPEKNLYKERGRVSPNCGV